MLKTELFIGKGLNSVKNYREFIKENQHIEIISVNSLECDNILLTYKEKDNQEAE